MPTTQYASLLDDPAFLARLEAVDVSGPPAVERPMSNWLVEPSPPRTLGAPAAVSAARLALGFAGFLLMMGIGGAAAAYVFADRLARILAR